MKDSGDEFVKREQDRFHGKIIAFTPVMFCNVWSIGVAVLGEPGYNFAKYQHSYTDFNDASDRADTLNSKIGISTDNAVLIVADTMRRQTFKNDQEDGLAAVKLNQREIRAILDFLNEATDVLEDEDTRRKFEDALD